MTSDAEESTDEPRGWYHCGRCGHVFEATEGSLCPSCGSDPLVGEAELAFAQLQEEARLHPDPVGQLGHRTHGLRPRKKVGGLAKFLLGWILFLSGLTAFAYFVKGIDRGPGNQSEYDLGQTSERARQLEVSYRECSAALRGYLGRLSPESQVEFTLNPLETLGKMSRTSNVIFNLDEELSLGWKMFRPIETSDGELIESVWSIDGERRVEAVFQKNDEGEWKLDWDQMVRYSTEPWGIFVTGGGSDSGEFRLFVRRRAALSGGQGDASRLIFFGTSPWDPSKLGPRSPEVEVDPNSESGQRLRKAFALLDDGKTVFGSGLRDEDPLGMIRVRVKLHWGPEDENGERELRLDEVLACHWMTLDDPGVSLGP